MAIQKSGEDYLESILVIHNEKGYVRSIDVANALGFSKPSVSRAMSILKEDGFITVNPDGEIILTDTGRARAEEVYGRHQLISKFFSQVLGVNPETAAEDACKIEHVISPETYEKLTIFVDNYK